MTSTYSEDLRERIVRSVEAGVSRRSAAGKFDVSVSFVIKLMRRWRTVGTLAARVRGGTKRHLLEGHATLVESLVATRPDITLDELRARLAREGIAVGRSSVGRFLAAIGLTHKKRRSMPPSRTGRMWRRRARSGARASRS